MLTILRDEGLTHIDIHTFFDVSEDVENALSRVLSEYQRGWPKRDLRLSGAEIVGNQTLFSNLVISYSKGQEQEGYIHLALGYGPKSNGIVTSRRRRSLENKALSIRTVLEVVGRLSIQCDIHCTVAWDFPAESVSPVVQLPLLKVDIPGTPFGQISGVRFTSRPDAPYQSVILDLIGEKSLRLSSRFVLPDIMSPDILERAIEKGRYLKDTFVNQKRASEGVK